MTDDEGRRVIPTQLAVFAGDFPRVRGVAASVFTAYCCGDRLMPHVLVAAYVWEEGYVDGVNMRGADRVTAARLPKHDGLDIFAPHQAVWHYMGAPRPAVAVLLRLPPPGYPDAPTTAYQAPLTLFVSSREQHPMSVTPGRGL